MSPVSPATRAGADESVAVYDKTRSSLLRGRRTMLKLSAAHLREQRKQNPHKRIVWVDLGGGTGWNIEEMDKVSSIV